MLIFGQTLVEINPTVQHPTWMYAVIKVKKSLMFPDFLNLKFQISDFCSHRRSWVYFSESLVSKTPQVFHSIACNSWNEFVDHKCNNTTKSTIPIYMGIGADHNLRGNFYLQTNPTPPYNRNQNGTYYTKL